MKEFIIQKNEENQRFDKYLKKLLPNATTSFLYKMMRKKNIVINKTFDNPKDDFIGDYGRLRQMFIIIFDNAVKFSSENSSIDVIFAKNRVHIRDYGCGIETERLPYIFERFHKSGGENNKTGSGLGLAIAREIAHRHNIKVSARSKVGEGTEFIFEF